MSNDENRVTKITYGFVVQEFDTKTRQFVAQSFIVGDQVQFECPLSGEKRESFDEYLEFDMVQPSTGPPIMSPMRLY